jgi:NAD(P)-dependent dehydrogenase (short-subunit alcohol dehydrogenase family)
MNSELFPPFNVAAAKNILIIGGGHGIGLGLAQAVLLRAPDATVTATFRDQLRAQGLLHLAEVHERLRAVAFRPTVEREWPELIRNITLPDLIINCVGFLHDETKQPERGLREFESEFFFKNMEINVLPTLYLAKHFSPMLKKGPLSMVVSLSAKVASLGDNKLGGWHSYRMAKVALNMAIRNIAVEFQRNRIPSAVLAIHPGTTRTELSAPFLKGSDLTIHEPIESANNILSVINGKGLESSGQFYSWDGSALPW